MPPLWSLLIEPLAQALRPTAVALVGPAGSPLAARFAEAAAELDTVVHVIDPAAPRDAAERVVLHRERSLDVLPALSGIELLVLDGDKNWYTVVNELRYAEREADARGAVPPAIVVCGVGWPHGRRDQYPDPDSVPAIYRHPSARRGLEPGHAGLVDGGLGDDRHNALEESSDRSGVRTAVEDFVSGATRAWGTWVVPGWGGVCVLCPPERHEDNGRLRDVLDRTRTPELLRTLCEELDADRLRATIDAARAQARAAAAQRRGAPQDPGPAGHDEARRRLDADLREVREALESAVAAERARADDAARRVERLERAADEDREALEHADDQRRRLSDALATLRAELVVVAAERDARAAEAERLARELGAARAIGSAEAAHRG